VGNERAATASEFVRDAWLPVPTAAPMVGTAGACAAPRL